MRFLFTWTLLILLVLHSCARMETSSDAGSQEITVRTPVTKAEDFSADEAFGLYAFYTAEDAGTSYAAGTDYSVWQDRLIYLENVCFAKVGDTWSGCTPSGEPVEYVHTPYYWPLSGSLYFIGYSPYRSVSPKLRDNITGNNNLFLSLDFTQNTDIEEMIDLKWFDFWSCTDGTCDFSKSYSKTESSLPVQFRRALSKVTFSFTDSGDYYKLYSLKLTGCLNKSTFYTGRIPGWGPDLTDSDTDGLADNLVSYVFCETASSELPVNELNSYSASAMVIPQYMDGVFDNLTSSPNSTGSEVKLELTIADLNSEGTAVFGTQTIIVNLKNYTDKWDSGKHYTYNIALNSLPIEFGQPTLTITETIVDF